MEKTNIITRAITWLVITIASSASSLVKADGGGMQDAVVGGGRLGTGGAGVHL